MNAIKQAECGYDIPVDHGIPFPMYLLRSHPERLRGSSPRLLGFGLRRDLAGERYHHGQRLDVYGNRKSPSF